mmetsp:Transcript_107684/g.335799  ORF Transcript_107684/g.335799 Transcript_107684/m.335799 type:complete len:224 (-) Transcript_107684:203-874(-)
MLRENIRQIWQTTLSSGHLSSPDRTKHAWCCKPLESVGQSLRLPASTSAWTARQLLAALGRNAPRKPRASAPAPAPGRGARTAVAAAAPSQPAAVPLPPHRAPATELPEEQNSTSKQPSSSSLSTRQMYTSQSRCNPTTGSLKSKWARSSVGPQRLTTSADWHIGIHCGQDASSRSASNAPDAAAGGRGRTSSRLSNCAAVSTSTTTAGCRWRLQRLRNVQLD